MILKYLSLENIKFRLIEHAHCGFWDDLEIA